MKIAINGFGRIGRAFLRAIMQDPKACEKLDIAAINIGPHGSSGLDTLFQYDSIMRKFPGNVSLKNNTLIINSKKITILCEKNPNQCDWKNYKIDWLVDASGLYTKREKAQEHLKAGAKKILITAPAQGEDVTIIPGVNDDAYDDKVHSIVSLGSCTTNCFAPMVKVIDDAFGIDQGTITTVHSYTNSQVLLDSSGKDVRNSRAAALNIIPSTTGASKVIVKIFPHLEGKIHATALRVPTPNVSLTDFTCTVQKKVSQSIVNAAFEKAAKTALFGILEYSKAPLVSGDFIGNPNSCIIDSELTYASKNTLKVFGWYDNEWGYSNRLKDFLLHNS